MKNLDQKLEEMAAAVTKATELAMELGVDLNNFELQMLAVNLTAVLAAFGNNDGEELARVICQFIDKKLEDRPVSKLKALGLDDINLN
jgi:hypothetical protein